MQFWNELEGRTIDGQYPLRRLVRSEGRSAWFETETQGAQATISLTEALTDADEVTARLEAARNVSQKNLVSIGPVGQVQIDNTLVVYAVMEHIEQSLSDVLESQALSADEGREVAEALVGALTAIHNNGMSHGHVEAASVLATEETVKLRSDCLQTTAAAQGDDVAGIGATLFHAFTQRKALTATDAQINRIPAPFAEIVRNSFARRWTLGQIANALKPGVPAARVVTPAATPVTPAPAPAAKVVAPAPQRPAAQRPVAPAVAAALPPQPPAPPPTPRPGRSAPAPGKYVPLAASPAAVRPEAAAAKRPLALYAAIAVGVLAILGWLLWRPHPVAAPTAAPTVTQQPAAVPVPAPAPAPKPAATKPSAGSHSRKPAAAAAATPVASSNTSSGRTIWRVVVYTYRGQTKAANAVATISEKHPDLGAAVFNPAGSDVYMVTLGGAMDHPTANALLDKARREGLPADTYVRNFSQ